LLQCWRCPLLIASACPAVERSTRTFHELSSSYRYGDVNRPPPWRRDFYLPSPCPPTCNSQQTAVVVAAEGSAICKAVTVAEISKRRIRGLHQNTQIGLAVRRSGNLDDADTPTISITLSLAPLQDTQPGYQAPLTDDQLHAAWLSVDDSEGTSVQAAPALLNTGATIEDGGGGVSSRRGTSSRKRRRGRGAGPADVAVTVS
jgi:DNA-binding protein